MTETKKAKYRVFGISEDHKKNTRIVSCNTEEEMRDVVGAIKNNMGFHPVVVNDDSIQLY